MEDTLPQQYYVTFLRHGESVGNAEDRFQGQADFPLTEAGTNQVRSVAARWQAERMRFDLCITSPLLRARQTADIVAQALGVPVEAAPDWMEIDNGRMAGLNPNEVSINVPRPAFMTPFTHFGETGESRWELYLRAGRALQGLLNRRAGRYLVVSHGFILNMVMYAILGITPQMQSHGPSFMFGNAGFAVLTYEPAAHHWRVLAFENHSNGKA